MQVLQRAQVFAAGIESKQSKELRSRNRLAGLGVMVCCNRLAGLVTVGVPMCSGIGSQLKIHKLITASAQVGSPSCEICTAVMCAHECIRHTVNVNACATKSLRGDDAGRVQDNEGKKQSRWAPEVVNPYLQTPPHTDTPA
jgi:hypothetical protein